MRFATGSLVCAIALVAAPFFHKHWSHAFLIGWIILFGLTVLGTVAGFRETKTCRGWWRKAVTGLLSLATLATLLYALAAISPAPS